MWLGLDIVCLALPFVPAVSLIGRGIKAINNLDKGKDALNAIGKIGGAVAKTFDKVKNSKAVSGISNAMDSVAKSIAKRQEQKLHVEKVLKNIENAPSKNVIAEGTCFIEGTEILTENDSKCIEDIKIGDKVYSKNVETGEVGYKEVKNTFVKEVDTLVKLSIEDNKIITTVNHPFWVVDKGWVEAGNLKARDKVLLASGKVSRVCSIDIEKLKEKIKVYNFEVEDWHTYYVSKDGILVHNQCFATEGVGNATGSYKQLVDAGQKDAHHIIQDAAMREIDGYNRFSAPSIQLNGPSTTKGTPHNIATSIQRQAGGGTYGAERGIGYKALRRAGLSVDDAKSAIRGADKYFMDELGLTLDSSTRIPRNIRGR